MNKALNKTIIFCLPSWETAVRIGSCWFEQVLDYAEEAGFSTISLHGQNCNTAKFKATLKDNPNAMLTGVGHGNPTTYTGERYAVLLQSGTDLSNMQNKPWYALSCKVGAQLGKDVVVAGCPAFIGYKEDFVFLADTSDPCGGRPSQGFMRANNAVVMHLIDGHTFGQAYQASQAQWREAIEQAQNDEEEKWLVWDMQNQVSPNTSDEYGDIDHVITEDEPPGDHEYKADFQLAPKENSGWLVYGTVSNVETGSGVRGALMSLGESRQTATDNEGKYEFRRVQSGSYVLKAEHDQYITQSKTIELTRG